MHARARTPKRATGWRLVLAAGALALLATLAVAAGNYECVFSAISCGGAVAQSASYQSADRLEEICAGAANQSSSNYAVTDVLAASNPTQAAAEARDWELYE